MKKRHFYINRLLKKLGLVCIFLIIAFISSAQAIVIKGKVSGVDNEGIPGVSVQIKGSSHGTVTNQDGNYEMAPSLQSGSYTLVFSSIGYSLVERNFTVGSESGIEINVTLNENIALLDEVLITGSTIKTSRRQLGNSINSVTSKDLDRSGASNLFSALQGKVPGAQITQNSGDPAGGMTIRLRGIKSLQGSSDPLYVIDGVIVSNSSTNVSQLALTGQVASANIGTNRMADINPADIESMNIINGAAAAAQYGSRASNGVVLITTKRGKSGKPQVNFSTSVNLNEIRKKLYISTLGKQFGFAGLRLNTIGAVSAGQIAANPGTTVTRIFRDGAAIDLASNLVDVTRYDYQDDIYRTGVGTDNALSISGGSDKTQYYASFSYMKNQGIVKGTDFQRYGLRVRLDQRLTNWAKLSAGISYTNSFANEKANGNVFYSPVNSINITNNIYNINNRDAAGNLLPVEPTRVNPLTTVEEMQFTQEVNRTVNDIQLNLTPLKKLNIDWIFGIDAFSQMGKNVIPPYPYASAAGLPAERYPNGFAGTVNSSTFLYNSDVNASYDIDFSSAIKLNLVAGMSYQKSKTDVTTASGETLAPFIETIGGASSTTIKAGYSLDQFDLFGTFVQGTFGYRNLAFVTAAVRSDRSSKFDPSQSNQIYPKFSASFVPSDLEFWSEDGIGKVFNTAKLRYSWGKSGNMTGIGSYDRFWQFSSVAFLGQNTILPSSTKANPNIRPEFMAENEAGLDLTLLNNKMSLGFTVYNQKITDLIVSKILAPSAGGTRSIDNVGSMENKGFEISLGYTPIQSKDFTWDFNIIFSRNRNKITKLGSPLVAISSPAGAPYLIEGQPASLYYGTFFARNADGSLYLTNQGLPQSEKGINSATSPLDYTPAERTGDGGFSHNTSAKAIIGNPNPDWTGSFVSNFSYKNLGLRFLLDAVQGFDVFNADFRTRQGVGIGEIAEKEYRGELPRGYIYSVYNTEEWRVADGSFVKLREVSLSYQLPDLIKNVRNITLSLTGRNLHSWDNYNGFDPETNSGGNNDMLRGLDFGNVPIPRTYQFKLSASF